MLEPLGNTLLGTKVRRNIILYPANFIEMRSNSSMLTAATRSHLAAYDASTSENDPGFTKTFGV